MKKSILNLGRPLNKAEQKALNGGAAYLGCGYVGQPCGNGIGGRCGYNYEGALHLSCLYNLPVLLP